MRCAGEVVGLGVGADAFDAVEQTAQVVASGGAVKEVDFVQHNGLEQDEEARYAGEQGIGGFGGGDEDGGGVRGRDRVCPFSTPTKCPGFPTAFAVAPPGPAPARRRSQRIRNCPGSIGPFCKRRSSNGATTASVLPEAVAEMTSVSCPCKIGEIADWMGVNLPKRPKNGDQV